MGMHKIIMDKIDEIDELSGILNTHDDTGDVNPDDLIRECAIAACLAFCNSKVSVKDRGDYQESDFQEQLQRVSDYINKYFSKDSYSVVKTAVDLFISDLTSGLIMAIENQSHVPLFGEIRDDLSITFKVLDGKNENENSSGVPTSS